MDTDPLQKMKVASPCSADWETMTGDERIRFCGQCSKHVYNISAMSKDEAVALVQKTEGAICVRLYRRRDGKVLTEDCPIGLRRMCDLARKTALVVAGLFGFTLAVQNFFFGVCTQGKMVPIDEHERPSPMKSVYFAARDIQVGEVISVGSIAEKQISSAVIPSGAISSSSFSFKGLAATRFIKTGSIIMNCDLEIPEKSNESAKKTDSP